MLTRFVYLNKLSIVPGTEGKGKVDINGNAFIGTAATGLECVDSIAGISGHVLISIITKIIKWPRSMWKDLDVQYVDGNAKNGYPSNTVWKLPEGGLLYPGTGDFFVIPGFSQYAINTAGNIINIFTKKQLSHYTDNLGYCMYGLKPDVGPRTILGRHRLSALAFLKYPPTVDDLDVNHINGIKGDDRLENLEWATRQENCQHAFRNDLRKDNQGVLIRDALTGKVDEYYSIEECARCLSVDSETVRLRLGSEGQRVFPPHHQYMTKTCQELWKEVTKSEVEESLIASGFMKWFKLTSPDGTVMVIPKVKNVAKVLNIKASAFSAHIKRKGRSGVVNKFKYEILSPLSPLVLKDTSVSL